MSDKKLPTRRDRREAIGFLEDFLKGSPTVADDRAGELADELVTLAYEVKVQRATDRLVLYFDLTEDPSALPEATTGADGIDNGGERESRGYREFRTEGDDTPAGVGG